MKTLSRTEKIQVSNDLRILALVMNHDITQEVIEAYARILADQEYVKIKEAISWCSKNSKFFPRPVEILERINPKASQEDADHLAGSIIEAIKRFGFYQGSAAKKNIGSEAWSAVLKAGGWSALCETPLNQIGTLRAQLRNLCMAEINIDQIKEREAKRIESKNNMQKLNFAGLQIVQKD